jgi:hypothetical protein
MVSVGILLGKVAAPVLDRNYLIKGGRFYDYAMELNAFGDQASDFSRDFSILTGVNDLHKLTLLRLKDVLPSRNVLAKNKQWCPICLEEWRNSNEILYEPLIWSFKSVTICAKHNICLNTACPVCERALPVLSMTSRIGYCPYCGCWLGSRNNTAPAINPEQLRWEQYVAENIGNLIKNESNMEFTLEDIYLLLITIIKNSGGVSAFSRSLDIPKSTVSSWIGGGHKPSLDILLKICYALEIGIIELFNPNHPTDFSDVKSVIRRSITKSRSNKKPARVIDWVSIEKRLIDIAENRDLGSPSVREVARSIECNERLLYNHFSELCNKIAENYSLFIQAKKIRHTEENRRLIIEAAASLYNNGIYPTQHKVESLISPLSLRRRNNYTAWKDALRILKL